MRKKLGIFAAVIMLAGCSLSEGSDISGGSSVDSTESVSIPEESSAPKEPDSAPAGMTAPVSPSYAETESGGVSLVKGEYDDIKETVSFEGEFVPFEELGYDVYECRVDSISENGKFVSPPNAVDKELLYFFEYNYWGTDGGFYDEIKLLNVHEYDLLTGTSETISLPEDCTSILYIDRDYILYCVSSDEDIRFYQINRASGETVDVTDLDTLFQVLGAFWGGKLVRCGDYIFFDRWETIVTEDGRYSETADILVRYSLTRNTVQTVAAAELLGAVGDNIIIAPIGSGLEQMHYTLDSVGFDFSADQLYLSGELIGYVVPTDRSAIFGEKHEAGRLLPSPSGNVYKPVLTANYGAVIEEFLLTESAAAAVRVLDNNGMPHMLIIDTKAKKASEVPKYGDEVDYGYIMSDGSWIYFSYYFDHRIIAINTAD